MNKNNYKIYVDMDGVLVNWNAEFEKISGGYDIDSFEDKYSRKERLKLTHDMSPSYYANMNWMNDGKLLYDYVKDLDSEILSHSEGYDNDNSRTKEGKLTWLKKHNVTLKPNLVFNREDKSKFANPNAILIDDREDNVDEFIKSGGKAILHTNSIDTINKLKDIIKMKTKHRIYNSILDPDIWNCDNDLKSDISDSLLKIANTFYEETELETPIIDIVFLGSAAGYNWTPTSDIDLHIIIDFKKIDDNKDLVKKYVDKLKGNWNSTHNLKIGKNPVELYIQDVDEENKSQSVYSLMNDTWIKSPSYDEPEIDKENIKKKYKNYTSMIDDLSEKPDKEKLKILLRKIYDMRQSGLNKVGEFSTENLVFKLLRKTGYLDRIKKLIIDLTDEELTS